MSTVAFKRATNQHGALEAANMVVTDGHTEVTHPTTHIQ